MKELTTKQLRRMEGQGGLVLQGRGGDLQEWVEGINDLLTKAQILCNGSKFQSENVAVFQHDGLTNLYFPFEGVELKMVRLAMWRLQTHEQFGETWLSGYVPNRLGGFLPAQQERQKAMYLTDDGMRALDCQYPFVTITCPSKLKESCVRINLRVEEIIANNRKNLPAREITGEMALRNLRYYQEYGTKENTVRQFFDNKVPDGHFHSNYTLDGLKETAFLAYIQNLKGFIQTEAERQTL